MPIIHAKVSGVSDGADGTLVQPSDWNASHTINDIVPAANATYKLGASGTAWTSVYTAAVAFPATQAPSADVNTLDDYEEGQWTPTGSAVTFASSTGRYTKIGRLIAVSFTATWPTTADTSAALIGSLPFTAAHAGGIAISLTGESTLARIQIENGQTYMTLKTSNGAALTNADMSTDYVAGSGIYIV